MRKMGKEKFKRMVKFIMEILKEELGKGRVN